MFLKWKDKTEVTLLTSLHDDAIIMKHRRTSSVVGGYEEIVKPQAIEEYNKYMGGVDNTFLIITSTDVPKNGGEKLSSHFWISRSQMHTYYTPIQYKKVTRWHSFNFEFNWPKNCLWKYHKLCCLHLHPEFKPFSSLVCSSKCGRPRKTTTYFCKKCGWCCTML